MFFPNTPSTAQLNLFRIKFPNADLYWTLVFDQFAPVSPIQLRPLVPGDAVTNVTDSQLFFFQRQSRTQTSGFLYNLAHHLQYPLNPVIIDGQDLAVSTFTSIDTFVFDNRPPPSMIYPPSSDPFDPSVSNAIVGSSNPIRPPITVAINGPVAGTITANTVTDELGISPLNDVAFWELHNFPVDLWPMVTTVLTPRQNFHLARFRMDLTDRLTTDDVRMRPDVPMFQPLDAPFDFSLTATATTSFNTTGYDTAELTWTAALQSDPPLLYNMMIDYSSSPPVNTITFNPANTFFLETIDHTGQPWYVYDNEVGPAFNEDFLLYRNGDFSLTSTFSAAQGVVYMDVDNTILTVAPRTDDVFATTSAIVFPHEDFPGTQTLTRDFDYGTLRAINNRGLANNSDYFKWQLVEMRPLTLQLWSLFNNDDLDVPPPYPQITPYSPTGTNPWLWIILQNIGSLKNLGLVQQPLLPEGSFTVFVSPQPGGEDTHIDSTGTYPDQPIFHNPHQPIQGSGFVGGIIDQINSDQDPASAESMRLMTQYQGLPLTSIVQAPLPFAFNYEHPFLDSWEVSVAQLSQFNGVYYAQRYNAINTCCINATNNTMSLTFCQSLGLLTQGASCDASVTDWCLSNIPVLTTQFLPACGCIKAPTTGLVDPIYDFCLSEPCFASNAYQTRAMRAPSGCPSSACVEAVEASHKAIFWRGYPTTSCGGGTDLTETVTTTDLLSLPPEPPVVDEQDTTLKAMAVLLVVLVCILLMIGIWLGIRHRRRTRRQPPEL